MGTQRNASDFTVRRMTRPELEVAASWAAQEGWNPGRNDPACFHAADPDGFFIGLLDGQPVASLSAVAYGSSFGFLGLYIVKPEQRGFGYGVQVWKAGMDYLAGRTIGLDAVLAQRSNYEKSGFAAAYHHIRHEGVGGGEVPRGVVALSDVGFEELAGYDAALFGSQRPDFLRAWIAQPGAIGMASIRNGRLAGYSLLRPCLRGFKIGPLFADDQAIAEDLFQAMAASAAGEPIFIDIPETNRAALDLAERHHLQPVFKTLRMYNQPPLHLEVSKIYGVTTLELG
jgi:hypothetical protein